MDTALLIARILYCSFIVFASFIFYLNRKAYDGLLVNIIVSLSLSFLAVCIVILIIYLGYTVF